MRILNVIICDDDGFYQKAIADSVARWSIERHLYGVIISRSFSSTEDFWDAYQNGLAADVAFLDIEIPGELSGLEIAKLIREKDSQAAIIFVTNYSEYACDGYSVNALRYLRKPISDAQLFECLDIAYKQWDYAQESSIFIDIKKQKVVLSYKQLLFIEARAHYLVIHRTNQEPIEIRYCISDILKILPDKLFIQCHRGFVVNMLYVRNASRTTLTLAGNYQIPVGSKYVEVMFEKLKQYCQGIAI